MRAVCVTGGSGELDRRAGLLQLALELIGLLAIEALLDRLRCRIDERLGLLEAQSGGRAYGLDHLDLLVAGTGQDHVDSRRLLTRPVLGPRWSRGDRGSGRHRASRNSELLLEGLDALRELEHRDALELVDPLFGGQLALSRHLILPPRNPRLAPRTPRMHRPRKPRLRLRLPRGTHPVVCHSKSLIAPPPETRRHRPPQALPPGRPRRLVHQPPAPPRSRGPCP